VSAVKRAARKPSRRAGQKENFPSVIVNDEGVVTHRIVPVEEYEALVALEKSSGPSEDFIREAAAILTSKKTKWHDANDILPEIIENGIASLRKRQGVTQSELGRRLGVPQSRVSRMERNEDALTLRVLKRLAKALATSK